MFKYLLILCIFAKADVFLGYESDGKSVKFSGIEQTTIESIGLLSFLMPEDAVLQNAYASLVMNNGENIESIDSPQKALNALAIDTRKLTSVSDDTRKGVEIPHSNFERLAEKSLKDPAVQSKLIALATNQNSIAQVQPYEILHIASGNSISPRSIIIGQQEGDEEASDVATVVDDSESSDNETVVGDAPEVLEESETDKYIRMMHQHDALAEDQRAQIITKMSEYNNLVFNEFEQQPPVRGARFKITIPYFGVDKKYINDHAQILWVRKNDQAAIPVARISIVQNASPVVENIQDSKFVVLDQNEYDKLIEKYPDLSTYFISFDIQLIDQSVLSLYYNDFSSVGANWENILANKDSDKRFNEILDQLKKSEKTNDYVLMPKGLKTEIDQSLLYLKRGDRVVRVGEFDKYNNFNSYVDNGDFIFDERKLKFTKPNKDGQTWEQIFSQNNITLEDISINFPDGSVKQLKVFPGNMDSFRVKVQYDLLYQNKIFYLVLNSNQIDFLKNDYEITFNTQFSEAPQFVILAKDGETIVPRYISTFDSFYRSIILPLFKNDQGVYTPIARESDEYKQDFENRKKMLSDLKPDQWVVMGRTELEQINWLEAVFSRGGIYDWNKLGVQAKGMKAHVICNNQILLFEKLADSDLTER